MSLFGSEFNYIIELQDKLSQIDDVQIQLDFPHIVVIGSQSSGKSSVLERIVGEDFIPRGTDTVTRRPLQLHLNNSEKYGVFSHRPNDSFEDFTQIHNEIESQTKELIKGNKFSNAPITLTLYGPDLVDLTLIDLPGITLVSSEEDNNNVEKMTKDICMEYIKKENCLILAVSGANQDIQNSPAIQLARTVDKEGDRTIGVLTKLDIMDAGTHAKKLLNNKHKIKLKHGFIGVMNRSQQSINDKVNIRDALEQEQMFFKNSDIYQDIASKNGITYLKQFLHNVLKEHLSKTLPQYLKGILDKYQELKDEIDSLPFPQNEDEQMEELFNILGQFDTEFKREIGGSLMTYQDDRKTRGINIRQIMHENYGETIDLLTYNEEEMENHIKTAENNTCAAEELY
ncbi:unnamed protein product [Oppiella nova]|uniref:Dynamin-type G domain-containing protein n=1 Tax=Oppiella nova TaxID=334625 RepID=A0A7R9MD69_9ACAR|nr:unnamed protein product [Oppiella nova]CAG2174812.1 unnamed protein product [Oppiella nova]